MKDNRINGNTQLAGVIGWPIHHTLSPAMHNSALQDLGINAVYLPLGTPPKGLKDLIKALKSMNALGVNVTIPYKEKVIPLLDELDNRAANIGAVNTIVFKNNRSKGYNTDGLGFLKCLEGRIQPRNKQVALLGGGGAGRAVAVSLVMAGVKKLLIVDVDKKRLTKLLRDLRKIKTIDVKGTHPGSRSLETFLLAADLLINATPLGLKKEDPLPIPSEWMLNSKCVMDLVYGKGLTPFLKKARQQKNKIIPGWEMLLFQGVEAFRLWTGQQPSLLKMQAVLLKAAGIK